MEANERFVIYDDDSLLPINVGAPSFAIKNNCKQLMVINIVRVAMAVYCAMQHATLHSTAQHPCALQYNTTQV